LGAGVLQDPILDLHSGNGNTLQTNDDWRYGPELEIEASTLAPAGDYDSAIIATLGSGNYTAIIHGYAHSTGIALVEAYDLDLGSGSRLAQISTRGHHCYRRSTYRRSRVCDRPHFVSWALHRAGAREE
jgi:hypothetical protein